MKGGGGRGSWLSNLLKEIPAQEKALEKNRGNGAMGKESNERCLLSRSCF